MLSLYIHIPFCQSKCKYCAFSSFPIADKSEQVEEYIGSLVKEIKLYWEMTNHTPLKTIYFWGGTPNLLWFEKLDYLISEVENSFNCEDVWELSFEFNPYPEEDIYKLVQSLQKKYWKKYPRVRFSFWIQSFDNEVLSLAGRKSSFLGLVDFLRGLQPLKQDNTVFNFDFIAFWKWNKSKKWNSYLRNPSAIDFFTNFVNSQFADSFSLYTLELFDNQIRKKKDKDILISWSYFWTDEEIYEEFALLKDIILNAWYLRYEISNFSLAWKSSIHNRTYREMEDYIWIGLNSSSFLNEKSVNEKIQQYLWTNEKWNWIRFKNTVDLNNYCNWNFLDKKEVQIMSEKDYLIESFFLSLRTDRGVENIKEYEEILVKNYDEKLKLFQEEDLLIFEWEKLLLTDTWMDVFNSIITEIMQEI